MFSQRPEFYFPSDLEWREWLEINYVNYPKGINLVFYKLEVNVPTMRWEEAVKVALCYGWIDSTVKSVGDGKRIQYFCPRNPKSNWSKLNKTYISHLEMAGLIHDSGLQMIRIAKKTGTWTAMDDVSNRVIPPDLQQAFDVHPLAFENYKNFAPSYQRGYLGWLHGAKRLETRGNRIISIIDLCSRNIKSRILRG